MGNVISTEGDAKPRCPHFGKCGGCATQDFNYDDELQIKKKNFRSAFSKVPDALIEAIDYQPGEGYGYRSRMDFLFHDYELCQRLKGNFRVKVPLKECHIAHPTISICLKIINHWFNDHRDKLPYLKSPSNFNNRLLKYVTVRKPFNTDEVSITFVVNREASAIDEWEKYLQEHLYSLTQALPLTSNIMLGYVKPKQEISVTPDFKVLNGSFVLHEVLKGNEFTFHSQGFFQNNSIMIEKIIDTVKKWIDEYQLLRKGIDHLYDLYGGCGVFGVSLAEQFKNIWVVDTEGLNIEWAGFNFQKNGYHHPQVMMRNVKDFLDWEEYIQNIQGSIVIVDPPRSGLGAKVIKRLVKRKPRAIFYVSCNYSGLAQELDQLTDSGDYQLRRLAPFDLFPRTPHLEALALLTLKPSLQVG